MEASDSAPPSPLRCCSPSWGLPRPPALAMIASPTSSYEPANTRVRSIRLPRAGPTGEGRAASPSSPTGSPTTGRLSRSQAVARGRGSSSTSKRDRRTYRSRAIDALTRAARRPAPDVAIGRGSGAARGVARSLGWLGRTSRSRIDSFSRSSPPGRTGRVAFPTHPKRAPTGPSLFAEARISSFGAARFGDQLTRPAAGKGYSTA
jgi:hypothetical protein